MLRALVMPHNAAPLVPQVGQQVGSIQVAPSLDIDAARATARSLVTPPGAAPPSWGMVGVP